MPFHVLDGRSFVLPSAPGFLCAALLMTIDQRVVLLVRFREGGMGSPLSLSAAVQVLRRYVFMRHSVVEHIEYILQHLIVEHVESL